jgi:hypothetical protein
MHIASTPAICSSCVSTAHRKAWSLVLAELVRDCWCSVTSKIQWKEGNSAHHIGDWGHIQARGWGPWGRFVQFEDSSVLHMPVDGQLKVLECAEEN